MKIAMKLLRTQVVTVKTLIRRQKHGSSQSKFKKKLRCSNIDHSQNTKLGRATTARQEKASKPHRQELSTAMKEDTANAKSTKNNGSNDKEYSEKEYCLRRKRFYNFTENVMAHDFLAYRRLDRMYHRATLDLPPSNDDKSTIGTTSHKYIVLSMSGDVYLTGEVQRLVGVLLALVNGLIDADFADCVFNEEYPHLIPTPPVPPVGIIAADAHYVNMEGKTKRILSPRVSNEYDIGFNQTSTPFKVKDWQDVVYRRVAEEWEVNGRDFATGRLVTERTWTDTVLKPWAVTARRQLEDYRMWKTIRTADRDIDHEKTPFLNGQFHSKIVPSVDSVDPWVPEAFQRVLRCRGGFERQVAHHYS
jgi:hypothetical protein